ncbi:hypothetical protein OHA38_30130 [Streptomyces sp. NBC_01732]|uniref:hypothetical protein n=1 Tax=Streptomyces sp. NBC_01732 TaxID=2975926 RepID=UPI00352CCF80|nr:hypothetical protein OHA38_30130 [Streptomyces sp. NBC_01732]
MSTTEASPKAPPDTTSQTPEPDAATVVDGPDGQSFPIEITLNQHPDDTGSSSTGRGARSALRAWPLALFGTEAASTGASALYASAGTAGFLTAAGVAAGGGLVAAGVAARKAHKAKTTGSGGRVLRSSGHRATLGSTGTGRNGGRTGGRGSGPGSTGQGGRGRSSTLGAVSAGASTPRTGPRTSPTSRNGASPMKKPSPSGNTPTGGGGSAGRGSLGKSGTGSRSRDAAGGRGGILRRLNQRRGGTGARNGSLGKGPNSTNSPNAKGGGRGRSTVRAWTRRAARSGMRGVALARRLGRQMAESPAGQALRDRIRSVRRALAKKAKAGARYVLRSAAAKVAAGAVGAVVLIPGLLLRGLAAMTGGVLRLLHLAPRNGTRWGVRFTRWSVLAATAVHKRLMRRAKDGWDKATRPDVLTDFDEPGHVRPAADEFGTDHFGGNLVSVFKQETEAVRDAYATYDPPMMLAIAAEYWGLPEGVSSVAEAVRQLAVNTADKYPADAAMADLVAQVYALLHQAVQKAQEIGPLFAKVHENDLRRYEEPRPGEHMWNILERRQDGGFDQRQPSQFVTVAQDVAHVYSRYEPGHMSQVAAEYEGIPDGIENIAAAINLLQVRSNDRYPVDKAVVDAIADVHQLLMSAASAAQELMPNFRRLHAPDISRHEAPRNGEESEAMWDV